MFWLDWDTVVIQIYVIFCMLCLCCSVNFVSAAHIFPDFIRNYFFFFFLEPRHFCKESRLPLYHLFYIISLSVYLSSNVSFSGLKM